ARPRPRRAHRRGRAGRDPEGPEGDRRLPRPAEERERVSLLEVKDLEVGYGGIRAVKGIDLEVDAGELVCLIGANGAGKSSTLRGISGLVRSSGGSVRYQGEELSRRPAHERVRAGLVMVPEGRGVFPQLTVEENLAMGAYTRRDGN